MSTCSISWQLSDYMKTRHMSGDSVGSSSSGSDIEYTCCAPRRSCSKPSHFVDQDVGIKMICSNSCCDQSGWMHQECFEAWEEQIVTYLKSCGRARSWNDKQKKQNIWTRKGYDLIVKMCNCPCGKGLMRKDFDYMPHFETDAKKKTCTRSPQKLPTLITRGSQPIPVNIFSTKGGARARSSSISSTGSSPPHSASPESSPEYGTPSSPNDKKFEFTLTAEQAAAGNIFHHRADLQVFNRLPPQKRNPYHIKMEDEGPYGNDETRSFVLSSLSARRVTTLACCVCGQDLNVYDKYPLVDGTLFLTPQRYISDVSLQVHGQTQYMNAVCMMCAEGVFTRLRCKQCSRPWIGSSLQVGTMYSYDIFAATPCCKRRLTCRNCQNVAIDPTQSFPYFSSYSHAHTCKQCHVTGYHFVKPLNEIFYITRLH